MTFKKIFLKIFIVLLVIRLPLLYLELSLKWYLINELIVFWLDVLILVFFKLSFKLGRKILNIVVYIVLILIFIVNSLSYLFNKVDTEYTYIKSPQNTNIIIIAEHPSFPFSVDIYAYQQKFSIFKKEIPEINISVNEILPFAENQYETKWLSEKILDVSYPFRWNDNKADWRHELITTE